MISWHRDYCITSTKCFRRKLTSSRHTGCDTSCCSEVDTKEQSGLAPMSVSINKRSPAMNRGASRNRRVIKLCLWGYSSVTFKRTKTFVLVGRVWEIVAVASPAACVTTSAHGSVRPRSSDSSIAQLTSALAIASAPLV
jgi:hypothetical protein